MAKSRKNPAISQRNDATSINSRRGKSRRAKRNASKKERQMTKKEVALPEVYVSPSVPDWMEEQAWCPECGAPHELVRPGKTQPTCICHLICDTCGGRIAYHSMGEDPRYPRMGGEWCTKCGPFGGIDG